MTTLSPVPDSSRRATMPDVARLAGVSIKTVSRVVNGEPAVHRDTAARVNAAIEQLGFRRNTGARNLRRGTATGTLGLIVEDVGNPFYSELHRTVERVATGFGRQVLAGSSEESPDRERELALEFCGRRVDGMLIVPAGARHGYLEPELRSGTPIVFVDRPPGGLAADTVLADNVAGAAQAVAHLAAHGHRRIAFLADRPEIFTATERLEGYRAGCALAGLPADERLVIMRTPTADSVVEALRGLLDGPAAATAVIAGNNRVTTHLLRALAHAARRPAVLGFDDFGLADLLDPPMSVVATDVGALGRTAAELLFARLRGDASPPRKVVLPVHLVPRGSAEVPPS